jgi:hypothetical protein
MHTVWRTVLSVNRYFQFSLDGRKWLILFLFSVLCWTRTVEVGLWMWTETRWRELLGTQTGVSVLLKAIEGVEGIRGYCRADGVWGQQQKAQESRAPTLAEHPV